MAAEERSVYARSAEDNRSRRVLIMLPMVSSSLLVALPASAKVKSRPYDEKRLLEQNKKIQEANNAPDDFPNFVREGEVSHLKV